MCVRVDFPVHRHRNSLADAAHGAARDPAGDRHVHQRPVRRERPDAAHRTGHTAEGGMSRQIVDESALPAPEAEGMSYRYVRSLIDPTAYINGATGEVFVRRDGRNWEHPGWRITRERGGRVEAESRPAWFDSRRYKPADSTDSAQAA